MNAVSYCNNKSIQLHTMERSTDPLVPAAIKCVLHYMTDKIIT